MRVVVQRVLSASVEIDGKIYSSVQNGLLVLVGVEDADQNLDAEWLAGKIANLRIFNDDAGVMNRSLLDIDGEMLVVSQFTLHAATKKGNRPSYIRASKPDHSVPLYEFFVASCQKILGKEIKTGQFGADMKVSLVNDGPVTIWMDSQNRDY